jgi:aminopeptidase N
MRYYNISIYFDENNQWIDGAVQFIASSNIDDLTEIQLDLTNNMQIDSIVGNITGFIHSADKVTLFLDSAYNYMQTFQATIYYNGYPQSSGFQALGFSYHNGIPIISSLSEPYGAREWWPGKDIPSDKVDSVDVWITVNSDYIGVSNGLLIETIENMDGTTTYHWRESYPITTYLISIAITNYETFSHVYTGLDGNTSMNVDYYVYPEHLNTAQQSFEVTVPMIEYYASVFGEYPFLQEKYGMAEFQWGGAMEHQTCTSIGSNTITYQSIIAHELAHQWWGDMVTCASFQHLWLNEGFASYSEPLYFGNVYGEGYYHQYMSYFDLRPDSLDKYSVFREDTTNLNNLFNFYAVYAKGAWVLHMLRHVIGDENFFNALLEYRNQFYMSVATTEDFRDVCEYVSGMELDWFFQEWVYETGRPKYSGLWTKTSIDEGWLLTFQLNQTENTSIIYKMPLDLLIYTSYGDTTVVIWDSLTTQIFEIFLEKEPLNIQLDPDNWVLKEITNIAPVSIIGLKTLPVSFKVGKNYPNPFNSRTLLPVYIPEKGNIRLSVINIAGKKIFSNDFDFSQSGIYNIPIDMENYSSGIYLYEVVFREERVTGKIVLLK